MDAFACAGRKRLEPTGLSPLAPHNRPFRLSTLPSHHLFFAMLFISPKTRNIAVFLLQILDRFISNFTNVTSSHTFIPQEVEAIKAFYASELLARDTAIETLTIQRDFARAARSASDLEVTTLSYAIIIADAKADDCELRLRRALSTDDNLEIAALELDVVNLEEDAKAFAGEKVALAKDLASANATADGFKTRLGKLSREYQVLLSKHAGERAELEDAMVRQRRMMGPIVLELGHYKHAVGILLGMSEREGMQLEVAVAFTQCLRVSGVHLGAVGIDAQRLSVLSDFVAARQGSGCAV